MPVVATWSGKKLKPRSRRRRPAADGAAARSTEVRRAPRRKPGQGTIDQAAPCAVTRRPRSAHSEQHVTRAARAERRRLQLGVYKYPAESLTKGTLRASHKLNKSSGTVLGTVGPLWRRYGLPRAHAGAQLRRCEQLPGATGDN